MIIGQQAGKELKGKQGKEKIKADRAIDQVGAGEFDALVIPGGYSPDHLRTNLKMVGLTRELFNAGKPVAAICHAGWMLVEADIADGRTVTSWPSIKTDLINAGARWVDREVVEDENLITSRNPEDLDAFSAALLRQIEQGAAEPMRRRPRASAGEEAAKRGGKRAELASRLLRCSCAGSARCARARARSGRRMSNGFSKRAFGTCVEELARARRERAAGQEHHAGGDVGQLALAARRRSPSRSSAASSRRTGSRRSARRGACARSASRGRRQHGHLVPLAQDQLQRERDARVIVDDQHAPAPLFSTERLVRAPAQRLAAQ